MNTSGYTPYTYECIYCLISFPFKMLSLFYKIHVTFTPPSGSRSFSLRLADFFPSPSASCARTGGTFRCPDVIHHLITPAFFGRDWDGYSLQTALFFPDGFHNHALSVQLDAMRSLTSREDCNGLDSLLTQPLNGYMLPCEPAHQNRTSRGILKALAMASAAQAPVLSDWQR